MSYGHTDELMNSVPYHKQLEFLVKELGAWAKLNPSLVSLWAEFSRVSKEITKHEQEQEP